MPGGGVARREGPGNAGPPPSARRRIALFAGALVAGTALAATLPAVAFAAPPPAVEAAKATTTAPPTTAPSGPTTIIATTAPPTTIPQCKGLPADTDLVFVGTVMGRDGDTLRFTVTDVRQGDVPSALAVRFPDQGRYLDDGTAYKVVATPVEGGGFEAQVKQSETECKPLTTMVDGTAVDTSIFGRFARSRRAIVLAFAIPAAIAFGALFFIVGLKRLVRWAFR